LIASINTTLICASSLEVASFVADDKYQLHELMKSEHTKALLGFMRESSLALLQLDGRRQFQQVHGGPEAQDHDVEPTMLSMYFDGEQ
jgi:hypothetical protein